MTLQSPPPTLPTSPTGPAPQVSIVSPVYGCRDCLENLADVVRVTMQDAGLTWELILVDDRGPDAPWPLIQDMAARDSRIRGVRLASNHGQHLAIWAGLEAAKGDWTAVIDCDLQDDPTVIPALYAQALSEDTEAVVVNRGSWSDSWWRRYTSRQFHRLMNFLAGLKLKNLGNFGLYSRRMVNMLLRFSEQEVFLPMMVQLTGLKTTQMTVDRSDRVAGQSSYSIYRLIKMSVAIIVRFSDRPLKLSALAGLIVSSVAALVSLVLVVGYLAGAFTVAGWTSVVLSVWFLSGLIMLVLGVHGFYLGRVFAEVQGRPRLIIEETTFEGTPSEVEPAPAARLKARDPAA